MTRPASLIAYGVTGRLGRLLGPAWQGEVSCFARNPITGSPVGHLDLGHQDSWHSLPEADAFLLLAGSTALREGAENSHAELARRAGALCRARGIGHLMLMSSAAVYGRMDAPLTEHRTPRPESPYGIAKLRLETAAQEIAGDDLAVTVLRLGNVAGADALLGGLTAGAVTLDRFPDGRSPRRSYIGPMTLARLLRQLAQRPAAAFRLLNLAEPVPVEMADLARAAGATVTWRPAPLRAIAEVSLDLTALTDALGTALAPSDPDMMIREWRNLEAQI